MLQGFNANAKQRVLFSILLCLLRAPETLQALPFMLPSEHITCIHGNPSYSHNFDAWRKENAEV